MVFENFRKENICKRLHIARFRGRDITSFRPADIHLGAYFKYPSVNCIKKCDYERTMSSFVKLEVNAAWNIPAEQY